MDALGLAPGAAWAVAGLAGAGRILRVPDTRRMATAEALARSSGGLTSQGAAPLFAGAWRRLYGRWPLLTELDSLLCVSRFDGGFGSWPEDSAMYGSHNLGANMCHRAGSDCSPEAQDGDSCAPLSTWEVLQGQKVELVECFRTYPTWDAAADDFLRDMTAPRRALTGAALRSGSLRKLADAMHREHYFTADPVAYAAALSAQAVAIGKALGRAPAVSLDGPAEAPVSASSSGGGAPLLAALCALCAAGLGVAWIARR